MRHVLRVSVYAFFGHYFTVFPLFALFHSAVTISFLTCTIHVNKMLISCSNGDILPPVALVWCVMPVVPAIRKNYIATHQHQPTGSCLEKGL